MDEGEQNNGFSQVARAHPPLALVPGKSCIDGFDKLDPVEERGNDGGGEGCLRGNEVPLFSGLVDEMGEGREPSWWRMRHKKYYVLLFRRVRKVSIHDIGPSVTHKKVIITMFLKNIPTPDIARRTQHTEDACDRYIKSFKKVNQLQGRMKPHEIAAMLDMSERLVMEYIALIEEYESRREEDTHDN